MKAKYIDIGARIRQEVDAQHWAYTDFARAINCSRSSLYNIFNSSDISLQRLLQISKILNVNFISEFCESRSPVSKSVCDSSPYISIPMTDGKFDLSKIPYQLLMLLRSDIDSDPRFSPDSLNNA